MPQVLAMALCQWRVEKGKGKGSSKAKAVDPLAVNGPMDGCLDVDEAENAPTKQRKRKTERKVQTKERCWRRRKCQEQDRGKVSPMDSVQTVTRWTQKIVQTWSTR